MRTFKRTGCRAIAEATAAVRCAEALAADTDALATASGGKT